MRIILENEYRCKCGKLLFKGILFDGSLEIKCRRCGELSRIGQIKHADDLRHYLLLINDKGVVINASESACIILGYSTDELVGKFFTQIYPVIPKELGEKFLTSEFPLTESSYFQLDTFHQTKEGKKIPILVLIKLFNDNTGEKLLWVSAILKNNTSDEKLVAEKIPKFVDNVCDYYIDLDKNGINVYTSPSVEQIFGFKPKDVLGKNYFDYLPATTRDVSKETFKHFSSLAQPYRVEQDCGNNSKGTLTYNDLYFTPRFDDFGEFIGYRVMGWVVKKPNV